MSIEAVLVDSREPEWAQKLTFGCPSVAVTLLDVGDYWLTCSDGALVLVERKTSSDLLNTLRDDRLFPQLQAMRERSPWSYLAICGSLLPGPNQKCLVDGRESGWNWSSVQGALLTAQEIGVHVVQIANDFEFEKSIIRLANRDRQAVRVQPARDIALLSDAEIVLTSLPGIGGDTAGKLLQHCGTAATALWALTSERDSHIPGVGTGIKRKVRRALGLEAGVALVPLDEAAEEIEDNTEKAGAA